MASSTRFAVPSALAVVLCGCHGPTDVVAAWRDGHDAAPDVSLDLTDGPYGDYNPDAPLQVLPISGDVSVTDPTLFRWQDTYWVFSTGPGISVRSSRDLKTFQSEKQVFAQNPGWIAQMVPKAGDLWSPCLLAFDGTIHLYYAASWYASDCACIGHATATSIGQTQTFVDDQSPVICSNLTSSCVGSTSASTDNFTAIDPAVILDEAGDPWMVFGSWKSGILIIGLGRDGRRRDPNGSPVVVAARGAGDGTTAIQGASLYHWRDYYYLFVSFDGSPNHVLRVGRAKKVTGPYLDSNGKDMAGGGGRVLLQGDASFKGPGSNMVFDDQDRRLNVYHAYDVNQNNKAVLRISPLFFNNDGWPVSAGP